MVPSLKMQKCNIDHEIFAVWSFPGFESPINFAEWKFLNAYFENLNILGVRTVFLSLLRIGWAHVKLWRLAAWSMESIYIKHLILRYVWQYFTPWICTGLAYNSQQKEQVQWWLESNWIPQLLKSYQHGFCATEKGRIFRTIVVHVS